MKIITTLLFFALGIQAADAKHKLLYALEATSCAVSFGGDMGSTYAAIAAGGHEQNILFAGRGRGNISWAKLIGYKAVFCAAPIGVSIFAHRRASERNADFAAFPVVLSSIGVTSWATWHNVCVIHVLERHP